MSGGGYKPELDLGLGSSDSDIRLQAELLRICNEKHTAQFNLDAEEAERQKEEYERYEQAKRKRSAVQAALDKTQSSEIEQHKTWYENFFTSTRPGVSKTTSGVVTPGSENKGQPIDILPTSSVWDIITGGIGTAGNLAAKFMGRPTSSMVAIGMENVGNSCYINASMQCLATVLMDKGDIPIKEESKRLLITEFNGLIEQLQGISDSRVIGDFEMQVFKGVCADVRQVKYAGDGRQYDGTEFIRDICETIGINEQFMIRPTASYKCEFCKIITTKKTEDFGRWAAVTTTGKIEGSLGLSDIICPSCKRNANAKVLIDTVKQVDPPILAVFIPKFQRNDATQEFEPVFLKFDDYIFFGTTTYKLVSVLNHSGGYTAESTSGHYTACCLREDIWYNINDSKVTPIERADFDKPGGVCTEAAYALFYIPF